MKSTSAVVVCPACARPLRALLAASLFLGALHSLASAQVVDPDPEIFDGSKTKREDPKQKDDPKKVVDDWEGPNLIIYDANGEGSGLGGTGMVDGTTPGLDIQVGVANPLGLPLPLAGGGAGQGQGDPSANPLQIPVGQQSTAGLPQQAANTAGAAQSASRPSPVSIGDPSQRIQTTAQGQAGNVAGEPEETGEQGAQKAGEDSTEIPNAANTKQTGVRGGGIEKGDAMPQDM